jgi:imidazoleglycerol phosphate dehydratase HisB
MINIYGFVTDIYGLAKATSDFNISLSQQKDADDNIPFSDHLLASLKSFVFVKMRVKRVFLLLRQRRVHYCV